jgi:hypothetical protein
MRLLALQLLATGQLSVKYTCYVSPVLTPLKTVKYTKLIPNELQLQIPNKRSINSPADKKSQNSAIKRWPYHIIRLWYLRAGLLIKR